MMAWIFRSAKWSAIVGGLVLCAITLMSVASITGRALIGVGLGPVPGDFEMVEVGTALAVFFFLPWCYLKGGHATVDLFYMHLPKSMKWLVDTFSDVIMLVLWLALTWMLWEGHLHPADAGVVGVCAVHGGRRHRLPVVHRQDPDPVWPGQVPARLDG